MPPGLGHGDEEGEDGAYDGADPEALQGRGDAPLVSAPADDWRNEAANSRRQTQGDARSEADVFAEVCLPQDDDGTVSGEKATGMSSSVAAMRFVLFTRKNMEGIMISMEPRRTRRKPKRSARTPPRKVMTTPMEKRMDKARLPVDGEVCRTWIQ